MKNCKIWAGCLFLILISCNERLTVEAFIKEVTTDEKYKSTYQDEIYQIISTYRPVEYMALIEINSLLKSDEKEAIRQNFEKAKGTFSNTVYFTFDISLKSGENIVKKASVNLEQYAYLQDYLNNGIINEWVISTDKNIEIKPVVHSYQQSYGSSPNAVFLVGFPAEKLKNAFEDNFRLVYNDKVFGLNKPVELNFDLNRLLEKRFEILF